jgi:hypothetical protein
MPASLAVKRFGALTVMAGGALVAAASSAGAWNATSLEALLLLQGVAGAAWGVSLMSGFSAALFFGHAGREGFMGGALNSEPEKHSVATGTAVDARRDAVACDGQARLRG